MKIVAALKYGILKAVLCLTLVTLFLIVAGIQTATSQTKQTIGVKAIKDSVNNLRLAIPEEKIYIHTDRSLYFAGDTLWFKAYVLDATYLIPTTKSKILFIEIHNDSSDVLRRISVVLKNGIGNAQIPLTRGTFVSGGYSVKAYTNWTQNFGPDRAFNKRIYVGSANKNSWLVYPILKQTIMGSKVQITNEVSLKDLDRQPVGLRNIEVSVVDSSKFFHKQKLETSLQGKFAFKVDLSGDKSFNDLHYQIKDLRKDGTGQVLNVPLELNRSNKIDLQFLPESGYLIDNLETKVAFKAVGEDGKSVDVKGEIIDSKGEAVALFESIYKGMGSLLFKPLAGEKYIARLTSPEGAFQSYNLPSAAKSGINLAIQDTTDADSLKVNINASEGILALKGLYYLVGTSRGVVCYIMPIILSPKKTVLIAKRLFPTGVARISLLNETIPINERAVFINHHDQLQISVQADHDFYRTRDRVSLSLQIKDKFDNPVSGSFSMAVIDRGQHTSQLTSNSIVSTTLLASNLKGEIEEPDSYFDQTNSLATAALDNLLLTQGWTGFDWKAVFEPRKVTIFDGIKMSRRKNSSLIYMEFPWKRNIRISPWFLQKDSANTQLSDITFENPIQHFGIDGKNMLREVVINGKKRWRGKGFADIVVDSADMGATGAQNLYELLRQKLPGLTVKPFSMPGSGRKYALTWGNRRLLFVETTDVILHDTMFDSPFEAKEYWKTQPLFIYDMVEVLYSENYTQVYEKRIPAEPYVPGQRAKLVEQYARMGKQVPSENDPKNVIIRYAFKKKIPGGPNPLHIMTPLRYYQPKYEAAASGWKNQRATIHWEPNIITDEKGKAIITFDTSDRAGEYYINLEGANLAGKLGSFTTSFIVRK